ncbi:glycosyltransferase family 4 protein [Nostoc sp. 'Lobaria pulmonaria (5183) cyanobiont']|uniref:glycosyltransferase family 4 protein n=1 Tax=Nostoc sp. 'Lobaria pulmonaria (5183) cyanobiont' TaxID=1618022 RepID=UPI000CF346EA|nr:glycosyltransferase family 4 protein [Nostoc sp. 'Lobaria pulmonaria (5183) cyanobiont']AVH73806.1 group 1 glycosyltransferase [Nostoc sp. 'Lobaria pulmonaria (5183) cyanobiont']
MIAKPRLYLIFPNIFDFKGGIQVYSKFLLKALQDIYPEADYDVFLKYDKYSLKQPDKLQFLSSTRFHYFGDLPKLLQPILFATKIIILAIFQHPVIVISTHVNYAIVCYILKIFTGIPYWVVAHGLEVWDIENKATKLALEKADKIISVSNYTRQRLLQDTNIDSEKIVILPNTFDASKFLINSKPTYLLKRYNLTDEQPLILTVTRLGSMSKYKGYDQILHALVKVRLHLPNVHFILAGKGDDIPRIKALVTNLNLQNCVTIAGFVPDKELCDHYNLCDVFALPSKGEGFGIVFLEALACGKPVLAGNQDGSIDPLANGKLGCLVDPDNVEEIADNLIQILQGDCSNRVIYQPKYLQQKTIEAFDFSHFRASLAKLVSGN